MMSISLIIYGGNQRSRQNTINEKSTGSEIIQSAGYGINDIHTLQTQISRKPLGYDFKTIIILEAQNLSLEAQNSLPKTLEEPPQNTQIILTTPNPDLLLPTIVSRCQLISLPYLPETTSSPQNISAREDAINHVENLIFSAREELLKNNSTSDQLRRLLKARHYLKSNTNVRLTLENLLV